MPKASFSVQLSGYTPANRDAIVVLKNEATGATLERKPFLDGSLLVRDLDPGMYEIEVRHPNLIQPIERRRVRLFPQPAPTRVPIAIPPNLFRDTPIRDIPDADLTPIQQTATSVRNDLAPIMAKSPGEVIRSQDWNTLAGAVSALAGALLELTHLVAPIGHAHPEIAEKIDEVQGNLRRFSEAFGRSLLELQRQNQADDLRLKLDEVLTRAGATDEVRQPLIRRIDKLSELIQADTPTFTKQLNLASAAIETELANLLAAQEPARRDELLKDATVIDLTRQVNVFSNAGIQHKAESEMQVLRAVKATRSLF